MCIVYIYTYSQISLVLLIHTAKSPFCCGKVVPKPIVHVSVGVLKKYHQHNSCFAIIFPLIARPIFFPVILAITWRHIPCPPRLPCLGRIADLRPQGLSHLFGGSAWTNQTRIRKGKALEPSRRSCHSAACARRKTLESFEVIVSHWEESILMSTLD